jgi:hypothetical protein
VVIASNKLVLLFVHLFSHQLKMSQENSTMLLSFPVTQRDGGFAITTGNSSLRVDYSLDFILHGPVEVVCRPASTKMIFLNDFFKIFF